MRRSLCGLFVLLSLGLSGAVAADPLEAVKTRPGLAPVHIDLAAWQAALPGQPAEGTARVLFIGNSFTFEHDLPGIVRGLATSGGLAMEVAVVAVGGARLAEHAEHRDLREALRSIAWTGVVLQDFSTIALSAKGRAQSMAALEDLASAPGAETVLFATWPRQAGHLLYDSDLAESPDAMNAQVAAHYRAAASVLGAQVAPVGTVWRRVEALAPEIALYRGDGYHASPAGTYVAALTILSRIAPAAFLSADFTPDALDPNAARRLRAAVRDALAE